MWEGARAPTENPSKVQGEHAKSAQVSLDLSTVRADVLNQMHLMLQ